MVVTVNKIEEKCMYFNILYTLTHFSFSISSNRPAASVVYFLSLNLPLCRIQFLGFAWTPFWSWWPRSWVLPGTTSTYQNCKCPLFAKCFCFYHCLIDFDLVLNSDISPSVLWKLHSFYSRYFLLFMLPL